jgi:hypothetical protein
MSVKLQNMHGGIGESRLNFQVILPLIRDFKVNLSNILNEYEAFNNRVKLKE